MTTTQHQLTATDSAGSGVSSSFGVQLDLSVYTPLEDYADLPGNIENFGVVPNDDTAAAANAIAINNALASDHAIFVPNGDYYYDASLIIDKPKLIYCLGGHGCHSQVEFSGHITQEHWHQITTRKPGESARFINTTELQPCVHIQSDQVFWHGGTVDMALGMGWAGIDEGHIVSGEPSNVINWATALTRHDSIGFIVDAQTGFTGGGVFDTKVFAGLNNSTFYVGGIGLIGPQGVVFRFNGRPVDARIVNFTARIPSGANFWRAYSSDPLIPGTDQINAANNLEIFCDSTAVTFHEESGRSNYFWARNQGRNPFASLAEAESVATYEFSSAGNLVGLSQWVDYGDTSPSTVLGLWKNQRAFNYTAANPIAKKTGRQDEVFIGEPVTGHESVSSTVEFRDDGHWAPPGTGLDISPSDIRDINHVVNTQNKGHGSMKCINSPRIPLFATGSAPGDEWVHIDGSSGSPPYLPT